MARDKIVIIGTGWAGYTLSQHIDTKKFDVTIVSPEDTSPYTPLLASAACGIFDFSLAEEPVRHKGKSIAYYKARVESVDFGKKICRCRATCEVDGGDSKTFAVEYDRLVLAPGCVINTFNTPGADEHAFFVRNVADGRSLQRRVKQLLELASLPGVSEKEQRDLLHIVVVGGGPTRVEISAELSDIFNDDFAKLYLDLASKMSITIHDAAHANLSAFDQSLRDYTINSFSKQGVQVILGSKIKEITKASIATEAEGRIGCGMVIWTAGNKQCALVDKLDVARTDRLPRIVTDEYLHVLDTDKQDRRDLFALGDAADIKKQFLPTTAEVAVQKAEYLARVLNRDIVDQPFEYYQKAIVAYIGGHDVVISGNPDWSGGRAWAAWRSKKLLWRRSWRRKFLISIYWMLDWVGGKEIVRA